jgi:hypothetical protein
MKVPGPVTVLVAALAVAVLLILARYGGSLREKFWAVRPGMAPRLEEGLAMYNWRRLAAGYYPPSRNNYNW